MSSNNTRIPIALRTRSAMINGNFSLPDGTKKVMNEIRTIFSTAAQSLVTTLEENPDVQFDVGRMIAAVDEVQKAKNIACDSVILPHGPK